MQAASQNQLAAYYMGIPVKYVFSMIWAISAAVATVAGILLVPKLEVFSPEVGLLSITAFAAAVVGRFGSLPGAIVGGLIIGIAEALSTRYLPDILIDFVGMDGSFANKIPHVIAYIIMLGGAGDPAPGPVRADPAEKGLSDALRFQDLLRPGPRPAEASGPRPVLRHVV